ncbi:MAG TPA: hypothetical protein PK509_03270 [Catalimonadaceae bacterium]|nr:hypothetical protein [Catalimonadaceae bacterium]
MLCVVNPLALKKILMNIFFSTFTILANHPPACDTISPATEVRPAPAKAPTQKATEPKPARSSKSAFYPTEEQPDAALPATSGMPDPNRRKGSRLPRRKI